MRRELESRRSTRRPRTWGVKEETQDDDHGEQNKEKEEMGREQEKRRRESDREREARRGERSRPKEEEYHVDERNKKHSDRGSRFDKDKKEDLQKTKNTKKLLEGVEEKEDNGDALRLEDSGDEVMLDEGQEEGVLIQETIVEKKHKTEHESPHRHCG
uniref:Uncharacterized protein n=1 Tax=Parascaris equorum TaxID=6256 RepID=A0A914RJX2_PAREQ